MDKLELVAPDESILHRANDAEKEVPSNDRIVLLIATSPHREPLAVTVRYDRFLKQWKGVCTGDVQTPAEHDRFFWVELPITETPCVS